MDISPSKQTAAIGLLKIAFSFSDATMRAIKNLIGYSPDHPALCEAETDAIMARESIFSLIK